MSGSRSSGSIALPDPGCESSEGEAASHGSPAPGSEASKGQGASHGSPAPGSVTSRAVRLRRREEAKMRREKENLNLLRSQSLAPLPPRPRADTSAGRGRSSESRGPRSLKRPAPDKSSSAKPAAPPSSTQSTRPRIPPYPTTGKRKDLLKWQRDCRILREAEAADPDNNLPTRRGPKDPRSACAIHSKSDKEAVRNAALSIVSVSSTGQDGFRGAQCTGIIIDNWEEPDANSHQSFLIATCSKILSTDGKVLNPIPKLSVLLPNGKTILDVCFLQVFDHYDLAILSVSVDFSLELPSIGHCPEYGQEVFVLARDRESSLMVRNGEIKWLEEADYLSRNYYMFLSCELPKGGNGGSVIDHDGRTRGMAFYLSPYPAVLSISTVKTCVSMYKQFKRVARPMLDLGLTTVAFMDVERQDVMLMRYGISHGLIVETVPYDSVAEKLGIKCGNVILSLDDQDYLTLPKLEDYLLSLGWKCLKENKSNSTIRLMLKVRDLNEDSARSLSLPVALSS